MKKFFLILFASSVGFAEEPKDWYTESPALIELGKNTFQSMCTSCHGVDGKAQTPTGTAVKARNFTAPKNEWKFGTKVGGIFTTLTKGSPGTAMTNYESLPIKTRFAIAHYIRSTFVAPENREEGGEQDYAKIAKEFNFSNLEKFEKIPFEAALKMMTETLPQPLDKKISVPDSFKKSHNLYQNRCANCHGTTGQGTLANFDKLQVQTPANSIRGFSKTQNWYGNFAKFTKMVGEGRPGKLKPPQGDLSSSDFDGLYQYVKFLTDN